MAITNRTLSLNRRMNAEFRTILIGHTEKTARAWVRAWNEVRDEWSNAIGDLLELSPGEWPQRKQILRATRATRALNHSTEAIADILKKAGADVTPLMQDALDALPRWQGQIIASQMPRAAGTQSALAASFSRFDKRAMNAIVKRTTQRIVSQYRPLSGQAREAMFRSLVRGVAVGENPVAAARRMINIVGGEFNGGLNRAIVVARTEMIDAHRIGQKEIQLEHDDVLKGWAWSATLDTNTCASCWAMHGTEFEIEEDGPLDHQQGRCSRVPVTKSWEELGFTGIQEPPSLMPNSHDEFNKLSAQQQIDILGPARYDALSKGAISWNELAQRKSTKGWRDSFHPIKVSTVQHRLDRMVA
jgi:hypothetical protein